MNRIYRLLRNNKEQGPFTSEELIAKNLKPYDLVWVDGRSAGWRYPGEIGEFKVYAPLPGEGNGSTNKNLSAVSSSVQAAVAMNDSITQPAAIQKPRYKVSAAWSKVQTVTTPLHDHVMVTETQKIHFKKINI